jgi:glycosyltransferase involved in cell wall biosynthesis
VTQAQAPVRRVLYVEGNVDGTIGGSFFSLLFLVAGIDRARFEPIVVFAADNELQPRFHAHAIRTVIRSLPQPLTLPTPLGRLLAKGVNFCRGWLLEPIRLALLLKREQVELVHLNNSITRNHPWMLAARWARVPCLTHERGINTVFQPRARRLARTLRAVISISNAVTDNFTARGLGDLPIVTIHNGLDPQQMRVTRSASEIRAELGVASDARLVGIVGNIKPWKGQEVVIRAIALLREEFPTLVCLLIGDTSPHEMSYREDVTRLIGALGLANTVFVTGYRSDVANYVDVLEVQIHASVDPEPFGRVLLEGMALRKPLVASGGGAVPEIVVDGGTGLLFTPGDPEALAAALRQLLRDPVRARAMGEEGRRRLESHYSVRNNVERTQALYEKVFEGCAVGRAGADGPAAGQSGRSGS